MDELNNNPRNRKELLKHMIIQLHQGEAPDEVRGRLVNLLQKIPYNEVVQVEQELINEGLPEEEVLKFCDIHTQVLEGHIDQSEAKDIPPGHPVETFKLENKELLKVVSTLNKFYEKVKNPEELEIDTYLIQLKAFFNNLSDVDKHSCAKKICYSPILKNITLPVHPRSCGVNTMKPGNY